MHPAALKHTLQDNEYYRALFDLSAEVIRQSGLLLDEDLEVLVNQYHSDRLHQFPNYKPSLLLKSSLASLIGTSLLAAKYSKWIVIPPILFTTVSAVLEIKNTQTKKKQKVVVENIVNVSKKINSLYSSIRKYMKTRSEIENKSQRDFFKSYNRNIEDFIRKNYVNEINFFNSIMANLEFFVTHSNNLTDDYNAIKDFKPFQDDFPKVDTMITCIQFLSQIQDIHIWLTSKMLSYIGIIFSPNATFTEKEADILLDNILPNLLNILTKHYDNTKKCFYSLRNLVAKLSEHRSKTANPQISNKLQKTLLSAVDNISIISEKSFRIFEEIENSTDKFTPELESALLDLRNHTYAAYDSLDLLCKLYGILSSQNFPNNQTNIVTKYSKKTNDDNLVTVHHDDDIQAKEENYELYLDKDFVPQNEPQSYVDDSGAYLSLMLKELRQSLKKHERFIEAKMRRGSVEEEKTEQEDIHLPQFDLKALEASDNSVNVPQLASTLSHLEDNLSPIATKLLPLPPIPPSIPPPPPPMPEDLKKFNLKLLEEESDSRQNSKTLCDSIKTLSSQLNRHEEVFGESGDEDD